MKTGNEIRLLVILHNPLELEGNYGNRTTSITNAAVLNHDHNSLFRNFGLVRVDDILSWPGSTPLHQPTDAVDMSNRSRRTLMMMTSVGWNNNGFTLGSNTVELD